MKVRVVPPTKERVTPGVVGQPVLAKSVACIIPVEVIPPVTSRLPATMLTLPSLSITILSWRLLELSATAKYNLEFVPKYPISPYILAKEPLNCAFEL